MFGRLLDRISLASVSNRFDVEFYERKKTLSIHIQGQFDRIKKTVVVTEIFGNHHTPLSLLRKAACFLIGENISVCAKFKFKNL